MSDAGTQLRAQVVATLATTGSREQLLQEMDTLARDPGFGDCADVWALALYAKDAHFFATFLLDHLSREEEGVIRELLPQFEANGEDALFLRFYRRIVDEASWNQDLGALTNAPLSDAELLRALERRKIPRERGFDLSEEVALQLYQRNPSELRAFHPRGASWRLGRGSPALRGFTRGRAPARRR